MKAKVIDKLWLWCHPEGRYNGNEAFQIPGISNISPANACSYLGLKNALMVRHQNQPLPEDFKNYAESLSGMNNVIWSIVGDASSTENDQVSDLQHVLKLARKFPNITGAILDDFFVKKTEQRARIPVDRLIKEKEILAKEDLKLWCVVYSGMPLEEVRDYLELMDIITFWTWKASDLVDLGKNIENLKQALPDKDIYLGCYMWDFGVPSHSMPLKQMEFQCERGLEWLKDGKVKGLIFLASCICDLNLEAVEWTRKWINQVKAINI